MVNQRGIPCIESLGVNVSTTAVTYTFIEPRRNFPRSNFAGLVLVRFNQSIPTGTTATLPIFFDNVPLKGYNGEDITVAGIPGTGIYLVYYNSDSKLLQLIPGN